MIFSLVVATINRNEDLFRLLNSLKKQTYRDFNVIIVDQNKSDFLSTINFKEKFDLDKVEIVKPQKLLCASAARNFGAKYAQGDIITFPDDDCWYEPTILERVLEIFRTKGADVVSGASIDPSCGKSNASFLNVSMNVNKYELIPLIGIEYSVFFRKQLFEEFIFDENISTGSNGIYQSGEITDWLFTVWSNRYKIYYASDLIIYHPFKQDSISNYKKIFFYAVGFGYVFKKQGYYMLGMKYVIRALGKSLLSLLGFNIEKCMINLTVCVGRFHGLVA